MTSIKYVASVILLLLIVVGFYIFVDNISANNHLSDIHFMYGPIRNIDQHRFNLNNKSDSDIMDYHFRILTAASKKFNTPLNKSEIPRLRQQVKDALSFPKVGMILFVTTLNYLCINHGDQKYIFFINVCVKNHFIWMLEENRSIIIILVDVVTIKVYAKYLTLLFDCVYKSYTGFI